MKFDLRVNIILSGLAGNALSQVPVGRLMDHHHRLLPSTPPDDDWTHDLSRLFCPLVRSYGRPGTASSYPLCHWIHPAMALANLVGSNQRDGGEEGFPHRLDQPET